MEILFLFTVTMVTIPYSISLLYSFYKYCQRHRGQILLTINPRSRGKAIYGVFLSIILGLIAVSLLLVAIGEESKGYKINVVGWVVIGELSLFFSILSLIVFQRRGEKVIQFTDQGLILNFEFFSWDEIDEFEWEKPIKIVGIIVHFKKDPNGEILFFQSGWRWRRYYHSFDGNTKQYIDEIFKSRGKIKT